MKAATIKHVTRLLNESEESLNTLTTFIEGERDKAQDSYDEKSEKWQESEAGEKAKEAIDQMNEWIDTVQQAIELLQLDLSENA
jgi:hypothetical protein